MTQRRALLQAMGWGALAAASGIGLSACSTDNEQPAPEGPVELRVAIFTANDGHLEVLNEIGEGYVAAHGDRVSKVEFDTLPADSYVTALQTQIAGGQTPDLAWIFEANARQFVDGGAFVDVTDTLTDDPDYHLDDVVPEALEVWKKDDRIFAYPFSNSPFGVYVNLDLVADAGQPDPRQMLADQQWTWQNIADSAAEVVKANSGVAGFQPGTDTYANWIDALGVMWPQWGGQPWSDDGTACELTSEEMVEFFGWFHDQIHQTGATSGPGEQYTLNAGQVAYKIGLLSGARGVSEAGFEWDFLPLPDGPAGNLPIVGQSAIGVLSQSTKIEPAKHFLAWFTNQDSGSKLAQFFPQPRHSLLTEENIAAVSPLLSEEMVTGTIIDQATRGTTKQGHKNISRIMDKVKVHLDAYWADPNADVKPLMEQACADIQGDLA